MLIGIGFAEAEARLIDSVQVENAGLYELEVCSVA